MNDNDGVEFGLIVAFIDESASFTNGFEMGILWNRMEKETAPIEMMIHEENTEQVSRMAKALKWKLDAVAHIAPGWSKVYLSRSVETKTSHLRLVK